MPDFYCWDYPVKKYLKTAKSAIPDAGFPDVLPFSNEISARLISRKILSNHFYEIIFEVAETVLYIPGQHCYLEVAKGEWRPYSIVSSDGNRLTFIIDSNPCGVGSGFAKEAPLEKAIKLRLPTGTLRIQNTKNENIVFVSTGSGITPFFAMLQGLSLSSKKHKQITLLWGIGDVSDEFSSQYLAEATKLLNLTTIPCMPQPTTLQYFYYGRVTTKIRELQLDFKNTDFYLCGNPAMINEMHSWLRNQGASCIYFEM